MFTKGFFNLIIGDEFQLLDNLQQGPGCFEFGLNPLGIFNLLFSQITVFQQMIHHFTESVTEPIDSRKSSIGGIITNGNVLFYRRHIGCFTPE